MKLIYRDFPNLGIVEVKLDQKIIEQLWALIKKSKENSVSLNQFLAGNIDQSYEIKNAKCLDPVLGSCIKNYEERYGLPYKSLKSKMHENRYVLDSVWVNFQYQHQVNPIHNHGGGYSFVIWMKIPTEFSEQKELPFVKNSNEKDCVSNFSFMYTNILGEIKQATFPMDKNAEGRLVFFPAGLKHMVYPFYDCEEARVTIAGNLSVNQN